VEATLLSENEELKNLADALIQTREEIGEILARTADKRSKVQKAHEELETSQEAHSNNDPHVRASLQNVGTQIKQEVAAGAQQEVLLKKEFDRISTLQKDVDTAIAGNLAVLSQKRALLSKDTLDQMTQKLINSKQAQGGSKWSKFLTSVFQDKSQEEPPHDLLDLLETYPEEMNVLGNAPTPFGNALKNIETQENDANKRIAWIHDLVNKKHFFLISENENIDDIVAHPDPKSLVILEWPKRGRGLSSFNLNDLGNLKQSPFSEKRALWDVQKFDSIVKKPNYLIFEYTNKKYVDLFRLSRPHPDLLAHLDPESNPYSKKKPIIDFVLSETDEELSNQINTSTGESALSIEKQIQLIDQGDLRSLQFFAQEEKTQLLKASEHLRKQIEKTEKYLSDLKASSATLDLSSVQHLTQVHEKLSQKTRNLKKTRALLQDAYDRLAKISRSGPEPRFQNDKRHLQIFLEGIDAQIFTTKALLQNLETLQVRIIENDPTYSQQR